MQSFKPNVPTDGGSQLLWIRPDEPWPVQVASWSSKAPHRVVVSFGGGNSGLSETEKASMPVFFSLLFEGFGGTAISGGTGTFDGERNCAFEITQIPRLLVQNGNPCVGIGSTPLTRLPMLNHDIGAVMTNSRGGQLDPYHHANVVVAVHPASKPIGWNGDLPRRFGFLEELLEFYLLAVFIFNGGDVAAEEIYRGLALTERGGLLFVVRGSGRESDKFIRTFEGQPDWTNAKGEPLDQDLVAARQQILAGCDRSRVHILDFADPSGARQVLIETGVLQLPPAVNDSISAAN